MNAESPLPRGYRLHYERVRRVCGSTVRDAMFRDYSCLLLEGGMAEPIGNVANGSATSNHEASLLVIRALFGWVSRSEEFTRATEQRAARTSASRA